MVTSTLPLVDHVQTAVEITVKGQAGVEEVQPASTLLAGGFGQAGYWVTLNVEE